MKDKQNVDAAMRILQKGVMVCLKEWSEKESLATRTYLKMGQYMLQVYTEKELTVRQRAKLAWAPLTFLRYWQAWLKISGYDVNNNFISQQTFDDTVLAGHSLILSMKMFSLYFPNHVFHPHTCQPPGFQNLETSRNPRVVRMCFTTMSEYSPRITRRLSECSRCVLRQCPNALRESPEGFPNFPDISP